MDQKFIKSLICPACGENALEKREFVDANIGCVVYCKKCMHWYPVIDGILEFLFGEVAYSKDCVNFWRKYKRELIGLGLNLSPENLSSDFNPQKYQQKHSDWFATNKDQTYDQYTKQLFWQIIDKKIFSNWLTRIKDKSILLDVGCAQGRSVIPFMSRNVEIYAFDISKRLVRQAKEFYDNDKNKKAKVIFFIADATKFPFKANIFDAVILYGVLHHLPSPSDTCKEIARVLKNGGVYFGNENNQSFFRIFFDLLQKFIPLWQEEAGAEPLLSRKKFKKYFSGTHIKLDIVSEVFIPPHVINILPIKIAEKILSCSNKIFSILPGLKNNGGLLIIRGKKFSR